MSSSKTTWLSLVAISQPVLPDPQNIITAILEVAGGSLTPEIAGQTKGMMTLQWGESTIGITLVDRPIPKVQLEGPCAAAWYWPDAATTLAGHDAHLLITLIDEGRNAIEKSMRLTWVADAVAARSPALGILWGPSGQLHQPSAFAEQAEQMSEDSLPLFLWIDFQIEPTEGGHRLFTTGLEAFDRKELEVAACDIEPQALLNDVYNVAHYAIDQPSPLKDADTIGLDDGKKLVAEHLPSLLGDDRQVVRLKYD